MRHFREPTAKNLLREPLILGVPYVVLAALIFFSMLGLFLFGDSKLGSLIITGTVVVFYTFARGMQQFAKPGWIETFLYIFEKRSLHKKLHLRESESRHDKSNANCETQKPFPIHPIDTLEHADLIALKYPLQESLSLLQPSQKLLFLTKKSDEGFRGRYIDAFDLKSKSLFIFNQIASKNFIYSLFAIPTVTTPLWLSEVLGKCKPHYSVISVFSGMSTSKIKERIERARTRNARTSNLSNVDSDVAFLEATQVLEGLSRGDDAVVECAVVIVSDDALDLDQRYFCIEKSPTITAFAISGMRSRFHRSHVMRTVTASDLILNLGDPADNSELATPILKTPRGLPLTFNPQDSRLEALHWLVTAASGAGKSFFVGLVLLRLVRSKTNISVLFIDHNRSFRRVVKNAKLGDYIEPDNVAELKLKLSTVISSLNRVGTIAGVELSDLAIGEKREAIRLLLSHIETWFRARDTIHVVYLVLDECWNFMRDEPLLVQRAFREFRKLNGAAIAITQSLSDFLMDESGRAIFQNAPIRILLRQAEDLEPYRGVLGLNDVELGILRRLRQQKSEFSECLIKTPFLSRVGRLYPTKDEYELLRTDNIREEIVREAMNKNTHQSISVPISNSTEQSPSLMEGTC